MLRNLVVLVIITTVIVLSLISSVFATLTEHQLFHLNSILKNQEDDKKDLSMIEKLEIEEGKTKEEYLLKLDKIEVEINRIIQNGDWPVELKEPADIHDYIENIK